MKAVITGDIVNSRSEVAAQWLPVLKQTLNRFGEAPQSWEIFRGDSFQLLISPENAFFAALQIKAAIKELRELDVRMAIGIGEQDHKAAKISESNGTAFIRSGTCFENLKKQYLGISTGNPEKDEILNLLFNLALLTMNSWSPIVAETIRNFLQNPGKSQTEMAKKLNKSQSSLSEALKRGGYDEILQLENFYRKQISGL